MHQKVWPLPYFFSFSAYALSPNCPGEKYEKAAMSPFCEKMAAATKIQFPDKNTAKKINLAVITRRLLEGLGERRAIEVEKKRGARPREEGEGEDCFSCFENSPGALEMRQENRQSLLSLSFSSFFYLTTR